MTANTFSESPAAPPRPRRAWRWIAVLGFLVLAIVLAAPLLSWHFIARDAEKRYLAAVAEADRLDPGWRTADLEARREVLPNDENSAIIIMDIKNRKLLPTNWSSDPKVDAEPSPFGEEQNDGEAAANTELLPMPEEFFDKFVSVRIGDLPLEAVLDDLIRRDLNRELANVKPALLEALKLADMSKGRFPLKLSPD